MSALEFVPDGVLHAAERVCQIAPVLTWRWRLAIYREAIRRTCETRLVPEMAVWMGVEEP